MITQSRKEYSALRPCRLGMPGGSVGNGESAYADRRVLCGVSGGAAFQVAGLVVAPARGWHAGRRILLCLAADQQRDERLRVGASPARHRVPSGPGSARRAAGTCCRTPPGPGGYRWRPGAGCCQGEGLPGRWGTGRGKDRHRLAAAIDPLVQQGLDAIRDPEQVRGIAGARVKQAAGSRSGRRGADGHGRGRAARSSSASCRQDHTQEHRDGEQVRSP